MAISSPVLAFLSLSPGSVPGFVKWGRQLPVPSSAGQTLQAGRAFFLAGFTQFWFGDRSTWCLVRVWFVVCQEAGFWLNSLPHPIGGGRVGKSSHPSLWPRQHSGAQVPSACKCVRDGEQGRPTPEPPDPQVGALPSSPRLQGPTLPPAHSRRPLLLAPPVTLIFLLQISAASPPLAGSPSCAAPQPQRSPRRGQSLPRRL